MDPIIQTFIDVGRAVMENPIASAFITGAIRSFSGWAQKKWYEKTGKPYDKAVLGATILKYEIAVNSIVALVPPEHASKVAPVVLVADIVFSAARKLKNGSSST